MTQAVKSGQRPLLTLIDLASRARQADEPAILRFMAVNDSHELVPYRQSALWLNRQGVKALSGVVKLEANAPFALWVNQLGQHLHAQQTPAGNIDVSLLPAQLSAHWSDWLPPHAVWIPLKSAAEGNTGGMLFVRDVPWAPSEIALLSEWGATWMHAWTSLQLALSKKGGLVRRLLDFAPEKSLQRPWWRQKKVWLTAVLLAIALIPVRLSVLAPAELVAANPAVIRSPLDGVVMAFHVEPNQLVQEGDRLFDFDEVLIRSRLDVARFALASVQAEYRQTAQQALVDPASKALLAMLTGKVEERRAEAVFLEEQLQRAQVRAPRGGVVLFDDPSEWIGRPVVTGERIMRVAAIDDIEIEAWVPLADAIPLTDDAAISLYLNASPLQPVRGSIRYLAHDAAERPDGTFAYRLRATINGDADHRVGLKGTARINARRVPLIYWVMRRPLASIRTTLGL